MRTLCTHVDPPRTANGQCKPCKAAYKLRPDRVASDREVDRRPHARERRRERKYRATAGTLARLRAEQGGRCYVCREVLPTGRREHVDHDHDTGRIRGLACLTCNVHRIPGMDYARRDPDALARFLAACSPATTEQTS
jgi:hypothetical protein